MKFKESRISISVKFEAASADLEAVVQYPGHLARLLSYKDFLI